MATVVNPSAGVLSNLDAARELVLSLGLVSAEAWATGKRMSPPPTTVEGVLRQLTTMPAEIDFAFAKSTLLTEFQVRQIQSGFGERLRMGDCVILNPAGASAYGENFHARKLKPPRMVLLQTFFPPESCDAEQFANTVVRHARELTTLQHPMIPAVLEIGKGFDFAYLAIERRPGLSVWSYVKRSVSKRRKVPLPYILEVIGSVAGALDYMHTRKWCHGEICPDTILLGSSGEPWLQSAGLLDLAFECFAAHSFEEEIPEYRKWWAWNASYGAPEVREGQIKPTTAIDIYSLGAVLFFLLSGRPFSKEQNKTFQTADWHLAELNEIPDTTLQELRDLLSRMLSSKPPMRATALETVEIIGHLLSTFNIPETMMGVSEPVPETASVPFPSMDHVDTNFQTRESQNPGEASAPADGSADEDAGMERDDTQDRTTAASSSAPPANYQTIVEVPSPGPQTQLSLPPDEPPIAVGTQSTWNAMQWFERGCELLETSLPEEAVFHFDQVLLLDESFWQAWYNRGLGLRRLWRMEEAADCFRRATTFASKDSRPWFQLGISLVSYGEVAEAMEAFQLSRWLGHPRAAEAIAKCELEAERIRGEQATQRAKAKRLSSQARAAARAEQFSEALTLFDSALELDPENFRVWYDKGVTHTNIQQFNKSIDCFVNAVRINPDYHKAWYNQGVAYIKVGRWQQAIPCFERAAILGHPMAAQAAENCRQKLQSRLSDAPPVPIAPDDPDQSQLAEETASDSPEAHYLRRGNHLLEGKLVREAIDCFDHALAHNPYYWEAWFAKARAWLELGEADFAFNCLTRVLKLNDQCASAWYERGKILLERHAHADAYSCFKRASELGHPLASRALHTLEYYEELTSHH